MLTLVYKTETSTGERKESIGGKLTGFKTMTQYEK